MNVRKLKAYTAVNDWSDILQNELSQVGFFVEPAGSGHYNIVDAAKKPTGWQLWKNMLSLRSPDNSAGICTVHFILDQCTFELTESPKVLYITCGITGAYISFIEYKVK